MNTKSLTETMCIMRYGRTEDLSMEKEAKLLAEVADLEQQVARLESENRMLRNQLAQHTPKKVAHG